MKTLAIFGMLTLTLLAGCTDSPRSQEQVRRSTAAATSTLKSDIKGAAEGIRDGLKSGGDKARGVDINSASRAELEALPGVTSVMARQVMDHRPYQSTAELRKKRILPKDVYDENAARLIVR